MVSMIRKTKSLLLGLVLVLVVEYLMRFELPQPITDYGSMGEKD